MIVVRSVKVAPKPWDDEALVKRAVKGEADAWHSLVERYSGYIFSLLKSARVPEADQPDAYQYVFVELFKALPKMENRSYLAPWIRQTALRHAIRLREKAGRTEQLSETFEVAAPDTTHENVETAERNLLIRQAIESLKEQCQKLVEMLFYEDPVRPYAEVAEELGIKVGSIGQIRVRCLDALQKALHARGLG